jgi:hypothetical protein
MDMYLWMYEYGFILRYAFVALFVLVLVTGPEIACWRQIVLIFLLAVVGFIENKEGIGEVLYELRQEMQQKHNGEKRNGLETVDLGKYCSNVCMYCGERGNYFRYCRVCQKRAATC